MTDMKNEIDHIKVEDNSFLLVKIGSETRPASENDIKDAKKLFQELREKFPELTVIITHHSISVELHTCK